MDRAVLQHVDLDHCRSCHGAGGRLSELSPAHWTAASLYHTQTERLAGLSPSEGCLLCHGSGSDSQWQRAVPEAALTFDHHTTHPLGVPLRATRAANAYRIRSEKETGLPLFAGLIECQTCHLLPSRSTDLLRLEGQEQGICEHCHQRNGGPAPVAAAGLGNF